MTPVAWLCVVAVMLEIVGDHRVVRRVQAVDGRAALQMRCGRQVRHVRCEPTAPHLGPYAETLADNRLTPDHDGIAAYLDAVSESYLRGNDKGTPEALIRQLGAGAFHEREEATQRLSDLTPLPLDALREAAGSDDPEVGERAESIITAARTVSGKDATPFPTFMEAVCRTIQMKSIQGLAPRLLKCVPVVEKASVLSAVCDAMAATATTNDCAILTRAMSRGTDTVRNAVVCGLMQIHTPEATDALRRALHDKQEHVRLMAARVLLNRAEREGLAALAEALESQRASIRHDAVDTLRAVTQQSFGYDPRLTASEQRNATEAWQEWIDTNRRRASLEFPMDLDQYRFERFKKSVSALSMVRSGTVKTQVQRDGHDIVGGSSGFDPGHGIVVVAYRHGQQVLRETFPTHVRGKGHCERFVSALNELPAGATAVVVANGEATQGLSPEAMRGIYAIGGQTRIDGFHAHGTYICVGYRGMLPGRAAEVMDASGGPLIFRGSPKGILFRRERTDDL